MSLNGEFEARKSTFRQILRVTASTEGRLANEKVRKNLRGPSSVESIRVAGLGSQSQRLWLRRSGDEFEGGGKKVALWQQELHTLARFRWVVHTGRRGWHTVDRGMGFVGRGLVVPERFIWAWRVCIATSTLQTWSRMAR